MISAKEAKQKVKEVETAEHKKMVIEDNKRKLEFNNKKAAAKKYVLPGVLKGIEEHILAAIEAKQHSIYFRFEECYSAHSNDRGFDTVFVGGIHLIQDAANALTKEGYVVKCDSYTPTTGGDPDSGEGAYQCGPTTYSMTISWE